ncbi:hypothetical protein D9758_003584 [Tetrapyrgos nigripes]|uniref:Glycosyltransferase family 69 protein n=1 Tax=Tetrapyrgos nigripes TaxID=182062 RepID=A0A8H5LWC8_9AGAR|nr:hypothetical protein D9758_003584 [Tetrapyrgos nigripes]
MKPTSTPIWRSSHTPPTLRQTTHQPISLPSPESRYRVLDLLSTLTPHYTRECSRRVQPLYSQQVHERFAPLFGHKPQQSSSSFFNLFSSSSNTSYSPLNPPPSVYTSFLSQDSDSLTPSNNGRGPHKYFFAINLYNSFDIIPDLFSTLFRVSSILGYPNVFVSIYENGSTDQTKALLRIYDALTRAVGLRVTIRTSSRTRGAFNHRIEYLAEVRNAAFVPLHELRETQGEYFDTIVFMNDILPCVDDLLELIYQSRLNSAGITCAADYMYHSELGQPVFYDNWVARDINGTALENAPFEGIFHHGPSQSRFQTHLPVQVQSCWNGIAVLDPAPFYEFRPTREGGSGPVKFRMARIVDGECSASECSLICNDYWEKGYGRILMIPRVKLAYDSHTSTSPKKVYETLHPQRRNLTSIRGYAKIGGLTDTENPKTDPQDRAWFGPHDRLFVDEEYERIEFGEGPSHVWCWGWDGAGDLEGPDVDPIWEPVPNRTTEWGVRGVAVRHERGFT